MTFQLSNSIYELVHSGWIFVAFMPQNKTILMATTEGISHLLDITHSLCLWAGLLHVHATVLCTNDMHNMQV